MWIIYWANDRYNAAASTTQHTTPLLTHVRIKSVLEVLRFLFRLHLFFAVGFNLQRRMWTLGLHDAGRSNLHFPHPFVSVSPLETWLTLPETLQNHTTSMSEPCALWMLVSLSFSGRTIESNTIRTVWSYNWRIGCVMNPKRLSRMTRACCVRRSFVSRLASKTSKVVNHILIDRFEIH